MLDFCSLSSLYCNLILIFSVSLYNIFMCYSLDNFFHLQFPGSNLFNFVTAFMLIVFSYLFQHLFYILCLIILDFEVFAGSVLSIISASCS